MIVDAKIAFKQLYKAIEHCHSRDIVHRDIKLDNIVVDAESKVKLVDFGLSINLAVCKKVAVSGTPIYLSPEIVNREPHENKPADIWAAAVCLYRCVLGRFPFKGLNEVELYDHIKAGIGPLPSYLSFNLHDLLTKCFAYDPSTRLTASQVVNHLWFASS